MSLKFGQDRHRSKSQGRNAPCWRDDGQITEHDVADHLAVDFGDQGHRSKTTGTQSIDQAGLGVLLERKSIHRPHGLVVLLALKTNEDRHRNERFIGPHND